MVSQDGGRGMTPHALAHLRAGELKRDTEYHIRMVSGDLYTGKILPAMDKEIVIMQIENVGPSQIISYQGGMGTHQVWLAVEYIESIEERS